MTPILTVRNIEQAAAWLELDGQLSDGYWENARPNDHWKVWCGAEVRIAKPGEPVGRNFYAKRFTYDFAAKDLLDIVGLRMLGIVRIARYAGRSAARILEFAVRCETGRVDWNESANKIQPLRDLGYTLRDIDAALEDEGYTMRQLRADLVDLKEIITIRVQEGVAR